MIFLFGAVALLALANGANDNFKGVATLYGGGVASYRKALGWATLTTFAGCLCATWLAKGLAAAFSGRDILPDELLDPQVAAVIACAAATVVLVTAAIGMPVSTTHAILGGLVGAALVFKGWHLNWQPLLFAFALPLAASPILSAGLSWLATRWVASEPSCVCAETVPLAPRGAALAVTVDAETACAARSARTLVSGSALENGLHFLSAGAVSFARGLNDAPKIGAILLVSSAVAWSGWMLAGVALVMALGGIAGSARIARTMGREITAMTGRQAFLANFITSALVIGASAFSLPVSTTHISCGALAGLGVNRRKGLQILLAWGVTLPASALIAALLLSMSR